MWNDMTGKDTLIVFDTSSGHKLWERAAVRDGLTIADGIIFSGSIDNTNTAVENLLELDALSGRLRWSHALHAVTSIDLLFPKLEPLIINNTVYVNTNDGALHKFDARSGREQWSRPIGGVGPLPTIANGTIYRYTQNDLEAIPLPN